MVTTQHMIGRDQDGLRFIIQLTLEEQGGERVMHTIEHEPVARVTRLSISGAGLERSARDIAYGGQCRDALEELRELAPGWTQADVDSIAAIWDRWHLNDLRAACAHMDLPEDKSYDARHHIECEAGTGYKYGTAWLVEPLPDDVVTEMQRLQSLPVGTIPDWYSRD